MFLLLSLAALASTPSYESLLPDTPSFETAKKRMYQVVYKDRETTFYCGCRFTEKSPDLSSCGLSGVDLGPRALQTEAEHVVPASAFGRTRACWAIGGREECLRSDPVFATFHNDLHVIVPSIGHINAVRSDYSMGMIVGEQSKFGACDFEVDLEDDKVEPPEHVRGDIARTYFYVEWLYGLTLSQGQRHLFLAWNAADPVDEWERERDRRIESLQGNSNPFVR